MKWEEFLEEYGDLPIIEPHMVRAGAENPDSEHAQLRRWASKGKLVKLARGKYVIGKPYRKEKLPLEYLANQLVYPSYVSLNYALVYHNLIPEAAHLVTSVTTSRPKRLNNPLGSFQYRHVKQEMFWGYREEELRELNVTIASPEKSIIDRFYFWNGPITVERIKELRLQNLDKIDPKTLETYAKRSGSNKLEEGIRVLLDVRGDFLKEYDLQ